MHCWFFQWPLCSINAGTGVDTSDWCKVGSNGGSHRGPSHVLKKSCSETVQWLSMVIDARFSLHKMWWGWMEGIRPCMGLLITVVPWKLKQSQMISFIDQAPFLQGRRNSYSSSCSAHSGRSFCCLHSERERGIWAHRQKLPLKKKVQNTPPVQLAHWICGRDGQYIVCKLPCSNGHVIEIIEVVDGLG